MATVAPPTTAAPVRPSWKRRVLRFARNIGLFYIGLILVLMFFETSLLFHPVSARTHWVEPPSGHVRDLYLTAADGNKIHAWWCPTPGWKPDQGALIYCHGNAGNLSQRATGIERFQHELGVAVLIFDYPGFGKSEGKPRESGCYAAADAAYDWLTGEGKVPAEYVLIYGGSLGGGVAVDLASRRPHKALILAKTFTSVADTAQHVYPFLPARWLVRNRFDSLAKIGRCKQPVFIAHGTADSLIPCALGERLFQACNEPRCFFREEGGEHETPASEKLFVALRNFLGLPHPASQAGVAYYGID